MAHVILLFVLWVVVGLALRLVGWMFVRWAELEPRVEPFDDTYVWYSWRRDDEEWTGRGWQGPWRLFLHVWDDAEMTLEP